MTERRRTTKEIQRECVQSARLDDDDDDDDKIFLSGILIIILRHFGMQSTPLVPLLPGPLWPGVVTPDKGPIYELN